MVICCAAAAAAADTSRSDAVDAADVALGGVREAAQGGGCADVPEEDGAVAAGGGEACVVWGDGEGEDFVGVGGVGLDEAAFW